MKCPTCHQSATTLLRNALTLQGVSFSQSIQGFFTCHHCGSLLRVTGFGKHFWLFFIPPAATLLLFLFLYRQFIALIGMGATTAVWIGLVLMSGGNFINGLWKFVQVEKAGPDHEAETNPEAEE